jgi:hypothetical protein
MSGIKVDDVVGVEWHGLEVSRLPGLAFFFLLISCQLITSLTGHFQLLLPAHHCPCFPAQSYQLSHQLTQLIQLIQLTQLCLSIVWTIQLFSQSSSTSSLSCSAMPAHICSIILATLDSILFSFRPCIIAVLKGKYNILFEIIPI